MRWYIVRFTTPAPVVSVTDLYFGADYIANDELRELQNLGWPAELYSVGQPEQFLLLPDGEARETGVLILK